MLGSIVGAKLLELYRFTGLITPCQYDLVRNGINPDCDTPADYLRAYGAPVVVFATALAVIGYKAYIADRKLSKSRPKVV